MNTGALDFQNIHDSYRPKIHRYLARMVGEHEAEDLTQEVFVRVNQSLETFRGESQLSTWIYRIASNAAIDKMRSPSFRQDTQTSSFNDSSESKRTDEFVVAETLSLEQQAMRAERIRCFGARIENLPANYREVVMLSELGELTNQEIAEALGIPLDVVKIRLHRGRTRLLQELQVGCKAEDWL